MVAASTKTIVIELDGLRHEAPTVGGITELVVQLAREAKAAKEAVDRTSEQQRLVEGRRRLGSVLLQLHTQIPHGRWISMMTQVGLATGLSLHTLKKAARIAAKLTIKGEWDLASIGRAREFLSLTAPKKGVSNGALAHHLKKDPETGDSNSALAHHLKNDPETGDSNSALALQSFRNVDGFEEQPPVSQYEAERLCRAIDAMGDGEVEDGDDADLEPIEVEEDAVVMATKAGASGPQLTLAAEFEKAASAVDRAVELCERELSAVEEGFDEAARGLASKLRDAADRIERRAAEVTDG